MNKLIFKLAAIRLFVLTLLITIGLFVFLLYQLYQNQVSNQILINKGLAIEKSIGEMFRVDGLFAECAKMYAVTGDTAWENRYNSFLPSLEYSLKTLKYLAPQKFETEFVNKTKVATDALLGMETRSFELVKENKNKEALEVLAHKEYDKQRQVYLAGMRGLADTLRKEVQRDANSKNRQYWIVMLVFAVLLPLLIVAWIGTLSLISRYLQKEMLMKTEIEQRNAELQSLNENLEIKVAERTKELSETNDALITSEEELRQNAEELLMINESLQNTQNSLQESYRILDIKNRNITTSIQYALRLQKSILPLPEEIDTILGKDNYFLLNMPRDIVSGDFYWIQHIPEAAFTIIVVADCTGHGVPGAFMTLIGVNILNNIVLERKIYEPSKILEMLHIEVQKTLRQQNGENYNGMDIAIITKSNQEIKFAGAKNDLYVITTENEEIEIIRGTRKSIGGIQSESVFFTTHDLSTESTKIVYLCSDGFKDQNDVERRSLGTQGLKSLLKNNYMLSLDTQKTTFEKFIQQYMQNTEQRDDILMIGWKIE
jgi:serine phosphatase RsbU (regulator of sigma subunit)